jgi:AcrR family transcriptional regulator
MAELATVTGGEGDTVVAECPGAICPGARAPRQARGQRRVDGILDAAEAVIAEVGAADASVHEIARRAGASVGSIYHFFPTKNAIVAALAERYAVGLQRVAVCIDEGTAATARASLEEFVDALVGPFAAFFAENPAYLVLSRAEGDGQLQVRAGDDPAMSSAFCATLETALARRFPEADVEDWALRSSLLHALGEGVLSLMAHVRLDQRERLFGEFKRAVVAYLASYERAGCAG